MICEIEEGVHISHLIHKLRTASVVCGIKIEETEDRENFGCREERGHELQVVTSQVEHSTPWNKLCLPKDENAKHRAVQSDRSTQPSDYEEEGEEVDTEGSISGGEETLGEEEEFARLTAYLERVTYENDHREISGSEDCLFEAISLPPISLYDYCYRIRDSLKRPVSYFIAALCLLEKYGNSAKSFHLDSYSIHRALITCVLITEKSYCDEPFYNSYLALVGGIDTRELRRLEVGLLQQLDFRVLVAEDEFMQMRRKVLS